jgi:hypothetical protein
MDEGSEGITTSSGDNENNGLGSCEAHYASRSRKIAAFQRARWAKIKAQQKEAA